MAPENIVPTCEESYRAFLVVAKHIADDADDPVEGGTGGSPGTGGDSGSSGGDSGSGSPMGGGDFVDGTGASLGSDGEDSGNSTEDSRWGRVQVLRRMVVHVGQDRDLLKKRGAFSSMMGSFLAFGLLGVVIFLRR